MLYNSALKTFMSSKQLTVDIERYQLLADQFDGLNAEHELMIAEFEKECKAFRKMILNLEHEIVQKREMIRSLRQDIITFEHTIMSKDEEIHNARKSK